MKKNHISKIFHAAAVAVITLMMIMLPANRIASAAQPLLLADVGYVDHSYGTAVNAQPTADNPESKVWYNDGFWWGIMFDDATDQYAIYKLTWPATWVKTATNVDTRMDTGSTTIDTRFDVLWDGSKLYVLSHIQMLNPSQTTNTANFAKLARFSYNAGTDTYTSDFTPVNVTGHKTGAMVLDKDSTGRLWVTFVSRDTGTSVYNVYVTYTITPGNDTVWAPTLKLSTGGVLKDDISSLVAYGNKVGVMWSTSSQATPADPIVPGPFRYAEVTANAGATSFSVGNFAITNITPSGAPGGVLNSDDHIKLVANSAGQVFAAVKTWDIGTGVIARSAAGAFSWHLFSNGGSNDTHPTLAYNATTNVVYMFVASNEAGGRICVNSMPVATMAFNPQSPCSDTGAGSGTLQPFIENAVYNKINNPTTAKRPFTDASGLVVLASDQAQTRYLHNTLGGGAAVVPSVVSTNPVDNATVNAQKVIVSATFNMDMNAASLTPANFTVTGPGGPVAGTVAYNAATRTATFTANANATAGGVYTATLNTNVEASDGTNLASNYVWDFTLNIVELDFHLYMPMILR